MTYLREAMIVGFMVLMVLSVIILVLGRVPEDQGENIDSKRDGRMYTSVWKDYNKDVKEPYKTIAHTTLILGFASFIGSLVLGFIEFFS